MQTSQMLLESFVNCKKTLKIAFALLYPSWVPYKDKQGKNYFGGNYMCNFFS